LTLIEVASGGGAEAGKPVGPVLKEHAREGDEAGVIDGQVASKRGDRRDE
jgi:hypothetical protein